MWVIDSRKVPTRSALRWIVVREMVHKLSLPNLDQVTDTQDFCVRNMDVQRRFHSVARL